MSVTSENSTVFRRHFSTKALHLVESPPTHHTYWRDGSSHHTWLDLFLLKDIDRLIRYSKSTDPFTVGHDFIELDYQLITPIPPPQTISTRNLSKLNPLIVDYTLSPILSTISILPLSPSADALTAQHAQSLFETNSSTLDAFTDSITEAITCTYDSLAPIRTFTSTTRKKPWVTADIRLLINQRQKLHRNASRLKTPQADSEYRQKHNEVCSRLSIAKYNYLASRINRAVSVTGKWRELRKLGLGSNTFTSPLQYFTADSLNRHYTSVCNQAAPMSHHNSTAFSPLFSISPTLNFTQVDTTIVSHALSSCSTNSSGTDGISPEMLKLASPCIVPHLTNLINVSLRNGIFPTTWKRALIVPLAKLSTPKSPSETRPIALLSALSKVIERIVHEQLLMHLTNNNFLDPYQSGFRAYYSTQSALLGILKDVRLGIDSKKLTALLAFDFSKAFYTIPLCTPLA